MIVTAQRTAFQKEHEDLIERKDIGSKSPILSLNPFLDNEQIIRVGGRLDRGSTLSYDETHPIFLPYACGLTIDCVGCASGKPTWWKSTDA